MAAGGGSSPEYNQISILQDLELAQETFSPTGGVTLYAAGPGARVVQVRDPKVKLDDLRSRLGELFAPRRGRRAHYQRSRIPSHGPATRTRFEDTLRASLGRGKDPFLLWIAGHGDAGATAAENRVPFWPGPGLNVLDLAEILDAAQGGRELRLIVTTCYSGGFAELVFRGAQEANGPSEQPRCGFFAATWNREASGCDANPNRRRHESFAIHFLHALRSQDRNGQTLPKEAIDFDGDGRVSLLEAFTRVRIASRSMDMPTSTSERWLRQAAPEEGRLEPWKLPEEDALLAALAPRYDFPLGDDSALRDAVYDRLEALDKDIEAAKDKLVETQDAEDAAWFAAAGELLARWPVLDDPWHPDFEPMLARDAGAIEVLLDASELNAAFEEKELERRKARNAVDKLLRDGTPMERIARAVDNKILAARLNATGGPSWERYLSLLRCERGAPP